MQSKKDQEFQRQLLAIFREEAQEHVQAISAGLVQLAQEQGPERPAEIVERIFRAAHSLKGAARTVDATRIESVCQWLEDVFADLKRGGGVPDMPTLDTLQRALDAIGAALEGPGAGQIGAGLDVASLRGTRRPPEPDRVSAPAPPAAPAVPAGLEASVQATPVVEPIPGVTAPPETSDLRATVRVAVAKLEERLLESEEMLTVKLTAAQRVADFRELAQRFATWRKAWAVVEPQVRGLRPSADGAAGGSAGGATAGLPRLLDFFDAGFETLKSMESRVVTMVRAAEQDRYAAGKLVDDLVTDSRKLLLLPFATISASFPKLVRELCRDQGKTADFSISGEDIEVDKRILEEIKDPLIHLLRNSVDHGIELPAERARRGKPERARITLTVSQPDASQVQLVLSDDGAGIDVARVKESAVKHQHLSRAQADGLTDAEAIALVFRSELSTSALITELSGRGLGLAIVREKAEKLGGEVRVESQPGHGAVFRIVVPAMRTTSRGVVVEAQGRLLVVATGHVACVTRARPDDVLTVEGRETISLEGSALPLVRLADVLELPSVARGEPPSGGPPVIVLGTGDQRVAFAVDAVLGEQEMFVKSFRKPLLRVRNVDSATVLGSGQVAPILNVADLLKSAKRTAAAPRPAAAPDRGTAPARTILVAEDSITSRTLLKSILQSAGYEVKTAVDGMEALTLLRTGHFDLLVSDVEMPRLNGFDLTARIRADAKLAELPVVLVTALAEREHRERGVDVGANAYLVKSSVDQSNLLDAVRRLI